MCSIAIIYLKILFLFQPVVYGQQMVIFPASSQSFYHKDEQMKPVGNGRWSNDTEKKGSEQNI